MQILYYLLKLIITVRSLKCDSRWLRLIGRGGTFPSSTVTKIHLYERHIKWSDIHSSK
jgi:hypothetical protein